MKETKAIFALLFLAAATSLSAADSLEVKLTMRNGKGDAPMVVMWIENDSGDFVRTLHMYSKSKKYYKDMLAWRFKSRHENKSTLDAISSATIKWRRTKTITVPVRQGKVDLLDGSYILRIESRKDKGGHYRSFSIPLPKGYKGGTHSHKGYISQVDITLK